MIRRKPTCDSRCYDLAASFLQHDPAREAIVGELAAHIQRSIEDWLEENRAAAS